FLEQRSDVTNINICIDGIGQSDESVNMLGIYELQQNIAASFPLMRRVEFARHERNQVDIVIFRKIRNPGNDEILKKFIINKTGDLVYDQTEGKFSRRISHDVRLTFSHDLSL